MDRSAQIFTEIKYQKKGSQCICLSAILIDSVFRTGENYYPKIFLEKSKYVITEKRMSKYINDSIEISSDEENSDKENYSED